MIPWVNDAMHVYEDVLYYIGSAESTKPIMGDIHMPRKLSIWL